MNCEFKGSDGYNVIKKDDEYFCQNEATEIFKIKGKSWNVCKEHHKKMSDFVAGIRTSLGIDYREKADPNPAGAK